MCIFEIPKYNFMPLSFFRAVICIAGFIFGMATAVSQNTKKPKNIILLIGDGMGLSEVSSSLYFSDEPSSFLRFNTIGLSMTSSSRELITDSAAGATAFASGIKTYNGAIGICTSMTLVWGSK